MTKGAAPGVFDPSAAVDPFQSTRAPGVFESTTVVFEAMVITPCCRCSGRVMLTSAGGLTEYKRRPFLMLDSKQDSNDWSWDKPVGRRSCRVTGL